MPLPSAVFLDTSVYVGQLFNFASTDLVSFIPVAKKGSLKFLLPDPTAQEIYRNLDERAEAAVSALDGVRRKAPFLSKWKHWPQCRGEPAVRASAREAARIEWKEFLGNFDVVKLGYEGVKIERIMGWYDGMLAPFREGPKRKEFPDAFALEALVLYARKENCRIAVVSADNDFKDACARYGALLYFSSLPRLTEMLLIDDQRVEGLRQIVLDQVGLVEKAILKDARWLVCRHSDRDFKIDDVSFETATISDIRIVGVGETECTVTFEANLDCRVALEWEEPEDPWEEPEDPLEEDSFGEIVRDSVEDVACVSGTAKVRLSDAHDRIIEVTFSELDQGELKFQATPKHRG